ncbi:PEP-CTERM sorting domain-containing protein [Iningainema tapete]|uniref:PEP-CTERM sorting domain-containing protein n=1 Tax=Iningainema tapete BLCC-T55 TaxID=2748662 RepID=A0A8J7C922_9CYAN|nr:PEP-CTERM sorting domain-containing protein [Iningainema tapete BLCC-T55]
MAAKAIPEPTTILGVLFIGGLGTILNRQRTVAG